MTVPSKLGSDLAELITRGDFVVPPYPAAALRLRRLVDSGSFGLSEVADAASADPALAAALLRLANSPMYRASGAPITTLARAVNRLGARAVAAMALAAGISATACADGPLIDVKYRVWRRSLSCALACQQFAPARNLDPQEAFLTGLLHGFGRSVAVGCLERVLPKQPITESRPLLEWLQAIEPHRYELARRVAERWQLPPELLAAMASEPGALSRSPIQMLVELADRVAAAVDQGIAADEIASRASVPPNEQRLIGAFIAGLAVALEALIEPPDMSKRPRTNAVNKPKTSLAGELRPLSIPLFDLKNRKSPRALDGVSVTPDGIVFQSSLPMQESCVTRIAFGPDNSAIEGWFSVSLCVPDRGCFRVEAQAFAAARELRELLMSLWRNAAAQSLPVGENTPKPSASPR